MLRCLVSILGIALYLVGCGYSSDEPQGPTTTHTSEKPWKRPSDTMGGVYESEIMKQTERKKRHK